jgi:CIC family chloride channel protein
VWLIGCMPGIGLLVALAARRFIAGGVSPSTADEYLHAFHDPNHQLGVRAWAGRIVAAVATLGSGGPLGLEGPSLYTGATVGSQGQGRLRRPFRNADRRVLMVAGAAAGVAAIFKAPATGAVFALEVPYRGDLARRMLLPALMASATGYLVFVAINGTEALFPIEGSPSFGYRELLGAVALGILAGFGARGYAWLLRWAKRLTAGSHPVRMTLAAGMTIGALFTVGRLLTGESLVIGTGYALVEWVSDPGRSAWLIVALLLLRGLATSAVVAGGGVGGLFVPLVVAGALTGGLVGNVVARADLSLFIVIGVAAFLGAGYRVPLAAVMFVAETTGRPSFVVPGLLAAVAAELVMGPSSVTTYQIDPAAAARLSDAGPRTSVVDHRRPVTGDD